MTRRYAIFDSGALGADLAIERGGDILTTIAPGLDISRSCRLTVPIGDFPAFCEFVLFGLSGTPIANKVSIGVASAAASLSAYVGGDAHGLGYRVGEGQIHHAGSSVETAVTGGQGDAIGVRIEPDDEGGGSVVWYRKPRVGAPATVAEVALPSELQNVPLFVAVSLGSTADAGDLSLQLNSGRDEYEHPAAGVDAGLFESPALPGALRIAEQHYVSHGDDAPPYTRWEGGITAADVTRSRRLNFWIWGDRGSSSAEGSTISVEFTDSARRFDGALGGEYRDQPVRMMSVQPGAALSTAADLGEFVLDQIVATDRLTRRATLKGPLAAFEVPMLRRRIRPDADPEVAGEYWPMMIGPVFSARLRLLDSAEYRYAIDAYGADGVGWVRDRGNPLDPTEPDYQILDGGQVLELANKPSGVITVDAGASGGSYVPPSPVDALDGIGSPFAGTMGAAPTRWASSNAAHAYYQSAGVVRFENVYASSVWLRALDASSDPVTLQAGRSYRYEIVIDRLDQYPEFTTMLRRIQVRSGPGALTDLPGLSFSSAGTHTGVFTAVSSNQVYLGHYGNNAGGAPAEVSRFVLIEIPVISAEDEEEADEAVAALARPLADMLRVGIEVRCRKPSSVWDESTAAWIDTMSAYAGQGIWADTQIMLRQYVDLLLNPYTAAAYDALDGRLAFASLIDPEDVEPDYELSPADVLNDPVPVWDEMRGLTRRIGCRRNEYVLGEDELASDLDAVGWRARRKLLQRYRYIRTYGGPLAPGLDHADTAEPLDTRLIRPEDAQAEINRIGRIASVARTFWEIQLRNPARFDLGVDGRVAVFALPLPRWFPEGTRRAAIIGMTDKRLARDGVVTFWSRAPWAPAIG